MSDYSKISSLFNNTLFVNFQKTPKEEALDSSTIDSLSPSVFLPKDLLITINEQSPKISVENEKNNFSLVFDEFIREKKEKRKNEENKQSIKKISINNNNNNYPRFVRRKKYFKERVGDWICSKCNNLNFSFRTVCNRCKVDKLISEKINQSNKRNYIYNKY